MPANTINICITKEELAALDDIRPKIAATNRSEAVRRLVEYASENYIVIIRWYAAKLSESATEH